MAKHNRTCLRACSLTCGGILRTSYTQVKQIAGRAGRHGTEWEQGWATCLDPDDLPLLYAGVAAPPKPAAAAGLFPMLEQLQGYADMNPNAPLAQV